MEKTGWEAGIGLYVDPVDLRRGAEEGRFVSSPANSPFFSGQAPGSGGHLFVPAGPRPWWSLPSRVPGSPSYWLLYLRGWVWMRLCAATASSTHCQGRGKPGEGATAWSPGRPDCGCLSSCHAWSLVVNKSPRTARRILSRLDARVRRRGRQRPPAPLARTSRGRDVKVPADWPARTACPRPPPSRLPPSASARQHEKP